MSDQPPERSDTTVTIRLPRTFAAFRHKNFRRYWFGNMVSFTGTWMQNVAKSWLVLSITNSPFFVGLDSAMNWLPVWLVSLPAGVLTDRFNKRNLMIITQSALAFFALILALLTWTKVITIYHILIISFLAGIFVALNAPVAQTLVPELVGSSDVLNAIALNSSMFNIARMIGPAIAGSLLTFAGPAPIFALNALSFLAIILALAFIRLKKTDNNLNPEPILTQLLSGLRFVGTHRHPNTINYGRCFLLLRYCLYSLNAGYRPRCTSSRSTRLRLDDDRSGHRCGDWRTDLSNLE